MQFKIPQNVQVEDKIVWILSIKDLIIAGIGGGIAYVAYLKLDNQTWPFISIPISIVTLAVIFLKINDMKFGKWLHSLLLYLILPQRRVWMNMSNEPVLLDLILNPQQKEIHNDDQKEQLLQQKVETLKKLDEISGILDEHSIFKESDKIDQTINLKTSNTSEAIDQEKHDIIEGEIEEQKNKQAKLFALINHSQK